MTSQDPVAAVRAAVCAALEPYRRVVLAVSGGRDSMVLLDAAVAAAPERIAAVATFDHGTGAAARRAVALVRAAARARGVPTLSARAGRLRATELAWREARWAFLRSALDRVGGDVVATGHTRADHVETVAMRILRGSGARGLAGLAAPSARVVRPLVATSADSVAGYAAARGLRVAHDSANRSLRYLRNRLRLELLPALEREAPGFAEQLLATARAAATWRDDVERFVDRHIAPTVGAVDVRVRLDSLRPYGPDVLAVLWPAIAARAGVRLDRRGTRRLVEFTTQVLECGRSGQVVQLSGGAEVVVRRGEAIVASAAAERRASPIVEEPLRDDLHAGGWRFRLLPSSDTGSGDGWRATLPVGGPLAVRAWRPGDRMRAAGALSARRVKRFFADAGIPGRERVGWPVVLAAGEIVWIPGVRRSDAATDRPEAPGHRYTCERIRT